MNALAIANESTRAYWDGEDAGSEDAGVRYGNGDDDAGHCDKPAVSDPCDCRFAIDECGGYTCGVGAACTVDDAGAGGPFWIDQQSCFVEHRLSALDGCDTLGDGVSCCNGTQQQ